MKSDLPKLSRQVVGNVGLFYVCYRLSRLGWNVLPTSRNARGVDIVVYSQSGHRKLTIQVKALSKPDPAPLGNSLDALIAEYLIVCNQVVTDSPQCFVMTIRDALSSAERSKARAESYWLNRRDYEPFKDRWDLIRSGSD